MNRSPRPLARMIALSLCYMFCGWSGVASAERVLFDFAAGFDVRAVDSTDSTVELTRQGDQPALRLSTGHNHDWPGMTLKAPDGHWDLSAFSHVAVDVANVGTNPGDVHCRVDTPVDDAERVWVTGSMSLAPGERKTLAVPLRRQLPTQLAPKLYGMRGYPAGCAKDDGIDPSNIDQLTIFFPKPTEDHALEITGIRAAGNPVAPGWIEMSEEDFFPMIDRFGQFVHKDWPGKIESVDDLARLKKEEATDLDRQPGPKSWNEFGGWNAGPQLESTGRFRVEKHEGKWWIVDPKGRLFWSHGIDCVRSTTGYTPITDREFLFADLPDRQSAFGQFYGRAAWAPHGYYEGKRYETYNFTGANLQRKHGPDWKDPSDRFAHRRLRSWGMNTIGNWSDPSIFLMRKTPYVTTIGTNAKRLEGSTGYWGKFPDVFDPSFQESLVKRLTAEKGKTAEDPWCIGYFVDNELGWGDDVSLAVAALASPPDQVAKQVFLEDLKEKYQTIEKLNTSWNSEHASWDALLHSTTPPDQQQAQDDLQAFYTRTAEQYFRTCSQAIQEVTPGTMYLGCRFAWVNDRAVRAAAKFCDIVSFNRYQVSVASFEFPEGVDKPAVIGEFHFGALDRGMFHTGLQPVEDQSARAAAYSSYVEGALQNPWLVGTHWFQYGDQATTGRGDGENYQIGFLDICDTPYPEIIEASRAVGANMYSRRIVSEMSAPTVNGRRTIQPETD